ncbi:MAG TPA: transcription termination/antitermination NusG family protein [Anaerolineales bacterium]|nr:transcription termination/antitermination NusG family protein [Anaerolineales bacterium]
MKQWYALPSKPMREALLWEQLSLHQVQSFYPRIRVRPVNSRSRKVRPYFPGYVFERVDLEHTNETLLLKLPGSSGIVAFGGIPSYVQDNLIAAIKRRVDQINAEGRERFDEWKRGDVLSVQEGPFKGHEAILDDCLSSEGRVRVLLKFLSQTQVRMELPRGQSSA